jgi:hypothetical protein
MLKGCHGNPVENDLPFRKENARILAIMTADDYGENETEESQTTDTSAKTGRLFDDYEPPCL